MDEPRRRRAGAGAPDEDASGGFPHGGWHLPYFDLVIGSPELAWTLIEHDLVDEYQLMIDPLVLGGGKRLRSRRLTAPATPLT